MKKILLMVVFFLLCSGCGTIFSRTEPRDYFYREGIYPATKMDLDFIKLTNTALYPFSLLLVVDLPVSLVFDTLLLPLDYNRGK
ncbi:YceK/YidQ family lipoprotein [Geobacter pelophilus]|uniref:YceK/YidQ family lipoprotein n=1 Tax=Geoanaerobacter pelophilus TaxID=60036 RepID=A0AAW4LB52_9BACT|nr:YceK/YidQ family lipoprotein [Geoanaerobacter pelophilus]MBT0665107.1 YceK/YidQ family lipoprotein [Geoanaerobacter pelophilus]